MRVRVSEHAAQRFVERVWPHASLREAVVGLSRLCGEAREVERPLWVREGYDGVGTTWLELADGLVVACRPAKGRGLLAVTVVGRGGLSEGERLLRNRERRSRRADVRSRRVGRPGGRPQFGRLIDDDYEV